MRRHNSSDDHDRQCQNKEPRKQGVNESSSSTTSTSVKDILRCRIAQKQAQQNKELVSKAQENFSLTSLSSTLSSAGYFCEVRSIVDSDLFPLPAESTAPSSSALIIEQSRNLQFSPSTGPFQPVRLIMYPHGEWRLDSPILGHRKIEDGRLSFPVKRQNLWIWLTNGFQTPMFFARAWLVLMVMTCRKNLVTFPKMCAFWMEHPCTQKTAKYGMSLAVITASRLQTECRKSVGIVSSANDMRKAHSIIDNL